MRNGDFETYEIARALDAADKLNSLLERMANTLQRMQKVIDDASVYGWGRPDRRV